MKRFPRSLALVALGAAMYFGPGVAAADAGAAPGSDSPCAGCPQAAAHNPGDGAMTDRMKEHLAGMKSAVSALRESEAKLAATEDPKAFRAAVIGHLKKLDDLQASHLVHMESMMGRMQAAKSVHGKGCRCEGDGGCRCDCGKTGGGHDR